MSTRHFQLQSLNANGSVASRSPAHHLRLFVYKIQFLKVNVVFCKVCVWAGMYSFKTQAFHSIVLFIFRFHFIIYSTYWALFVCNIKLCACVCLEFWAKAHSKISIRCSSVSNQNHWKYVQYYVVFVCLYHATLFHCPIIKKKYPNECSKPIWMLLPSLTLTT